MISGKKYSALFLQIMIITLAFLVVPAAANAPPTVLEGTLMIDGEPAPVGTEVALVVDGNVVGQTTVTNEGLIGDERANRLGVSSDYDVVTVYVNGVETKTLDFNSYDDSEVVSLDISATSSVQETPVETPVEEDEEKVTSGGGGGFSTSTETTETTEVETSGVSESVSAETEETILESTTEENAAEVEEEKIPESETASSTSGIIAIVGFALIGIAAVSYGYRSRK
ncbi:hypothetical protein [Methanolobus bombayensis]|uniref:hypothetical protein n=1 Tax=Methanolobus bombayensis TaxID=38023 RepID=UPI001AE7864B|nr:hypothetical protein [Methanolobus bombayensis]MBP1909046.1 hypothetical protein [Methanolobus bombayensis]